MWYAINFTMQTLTLLAVAFFKASFATPLVVGLDDLSSFDSSMPAPGNLLADPFPTPSGQSIIPDQPLNLGDQVAPTTDTQAALQTKPDDNDNSEGPTIQVASAAASSMDAKVNLVDPLDMHPSNTDPSNTDQSKLSTSLHLPPPSPNSNIIDESKNNLVTSDDNPTTATSDSENACVDRGTGSASKVRRGGVSDIFNSIQEHFWPPKPALCYPIQGTTEDTTAPPLLPKPKYPNPDPNPTPDSSPKQPDTRPLGPEVDQQYWFNPWIDGGRYFKGSASCNQLFPNSIHIYTVVCSGPVVWNSDVWLPHTLAKEVRGCNRCTCLSLPPVNKIKNKIRPPSPRLLLRT